MIKQLLFVFALVMGFTVCALAQHVLPKLAYSYNALEPYIDSTTMNIHYNNHHQTYINNLNKALEKHPDLQVKSIEDLVRNLKKLPQDVLAIVRNHGGGHYNHSLFWSLLTPAANSKFEGNLATAIVKEFGSFERFQDTFNKAALGRFGSGWVWLCYNIQKDQLFITTTANQDCPIMDLVNKGQSQHTHIILALDVWEHAYYLKYQYKRGDYLKSFWNVVNWRESNRLYEQAHAMMKK